MRTYEERKSRLERARLYLVCGPKPRAWLEAVIKAGVDVVQLRDKDVSDEEILKAATEFRQACDEHGALFFVNDRPDLAAAAGADGVHVGQDDLPVAEARRTAPGLLVGLSTHSIEQVDAAHEAEPDYIAVGPVHETPTKPGRPAIGLEPIRHTATHAQMPWFAIGGIDSSNLHEVVDAGAKRIVVVRAIADSKHPPSAARALRRGLNRPVLEPLAPGERPRAVTVAAIVAALLALGNVIAFSAGLKLRGGHSPNAAQIAVTAALLLVAAGGMWRARYWAVLGFQVLLAIVLLGVFLSLVRVSSVRGALIAIAVAAPAGVLFWTLVKAMARIQMPERPGHVQDG